jgi:hypothetical protein
MRFPETKLMKKTFDLFTELDIPLLDYHISDPEKQTWLAYNGRRFRLADVKTYDNDPFGVGCQNGGNVPEEYAKKDPSKLLRDAIDPFICELLRDYSTGLDYLFQHDEYSTRSYLSKKYPQSVIDYMETMCFGTGWFDRALA